MSEISEICCSAMIARTTACELLGHAFLSYAVLLAHLRLNILSLLSLEAKASVDSCRGFIGTCRLEGHGGEATLDINLLSLILVFNVFS